MVSCKTILMNPRASAGNVKRNHTEQSIISICCPLIGSLVVPQVVNYSDSRTAEEICESSSKMITFIDLAGHHKYLKTTVFGLTSYCPDFAMLVVSANTGIGELRDHSCPGEPGHEAPRSSEFL